MTSLRKSKITKVVALLLVNTLVIQIVSPGLMAQTTGTQPELTGFMPIDANNMVDPFTGDFSYNIPLLQVPGPGGGYPINMAYQSGVTMGEEASWVGLGWSLNVGTINRMVRGIPDEFDGQQKMEKTQYMRPNKTVSVDLGAKWSEIFGADLDKLDINLSANAIVNYNNYNGWSIVPGLGLDVVTNQNLKSQHQRTDSITKGDTRSTGVAEKSTKNQNEANKEAVKLSLGQINSTYSKISYGYHQFLSTGMSFNNLHSTINFINLPRTTYSVAFSGKAGGVLFGITGDVNFKASYTESKISATTRSMPAFGYNHLEEGKNSGAVLLDYQRAHEGLLHPETKLLPMPIPTYDMFFVNAQGLGGSIRGYRNDIPVLSDPTFNELSASTQGSLEFNFLGAETKLGGGMTFFNTDGYSGKWKDNPSGIYDIYAKVKPDNTPLYEAVAYKFSDELTANTWAFGLDNRHAQKLNLKGEFSSLSFKPTTTNQLSTNTGNDGNLNLSDAFRPQRNKRVKNVQFFTQGDMAKLYTGTSFGRQIKVGSTLENFQYGEVIHPTNSLESIYDSHLGEIQVTQGSGVKYKFGIPAYTRVQEEVVYAIPSGTNPEGATIPYSIDDDDIDNDNGRDAYYSKVVTPIHPHAFLLTEILSEDYVDVSNDGPSQDDLGDYVKFSYERKYKNFGTRSITGPQSTLNAGYLSDPNDDKASYTYTEKDIYYVNEIRTKTHVAVFVRSATPRTDGIEVNRAGASTNGRTLDKLDRIELYRLDENNEPELNPIKTVHFVYATDPGVSKPSIKGGGSNSSGTRLTLVKVYFSYGDQNVSKTKSNLSSYEFTYDIGEDYALENTDRWGNYQSKQQNPLGNNKLFPYTQQLDDVAAKENASMYHLTTIKTPYGGVYTIDYESDDYQYVQNKKATRMFEVVGFVNSPTEEGIGDLSSDISHKANDENNVDNLYLVFRRDETTNTNADVKAYIEGLNEVYFKMFTGLKESNKVTSGFDINSKAHDYIDGYAQIDPTSYGIFDTPSNGLAYVKIKAAKVPGYLTYMHPVRLAGLNYLRLNRPDLVAMVSNFDFSAATTLTKVSGMINSMVGTVLGELKDGLYLDRVLTRDYCTDIHTAHAEHKSIIRLNEVDGRKYGGGNRVRSITVSDNWDPMTNSGESTSEYTTYYDYSLPDGTSSGVASWEPETGKEENALISPLRYSSSSNLFIKDDALIQELPIGHTLYPSPKVGYSRVVSYQNNSNDEARNYGTGIQVFEYYTAKDYPFYAEYTDIQRYQDKPSLQILNFLGIKLYRFDGYSQGYSVTLNDMHGKMKSTSTYESSKLHNLEAPVTRTEYFYKSKNGFESGKFNAVDNEVPTLTGHAQMATHTLGTEVDMCLEMREGSTITKSNGLNVNTNFSPPLIIIPSAFPGFSTITTGTRTVVFSKVVSQTAILDYVKVQQNGAEAITHNLAYDPETGEAILTSVNNEYGNEIFNYSIPGHWYYNALKGAYNNIGYTFTVPPPGNPTPPQIAQIVVAGDVLMNTTNGDTYWVSKATNGTLTYSKQDNSLPVNSLPAGDYKIIQSGYDNMQLAKVGSITALINPADPAAMNDQVLENLNNTTTIHGPVEQFDLFRCDNGQLWGPATAYSGVVNVDFSLPPLVSLENLPDLNNRAVIILKDDGEHGCDRVILFPESFTGNVLDYGNFKQLGNGQVSAQNKNNGSIIICEFFANLCDLYPCMKDVIVASAVTFNDNFNYPTNEYAANLSSADVLNNPYRYGTRGIWRPNENYAFFKARKQFDDNQLETRIQTDGTYDGFSMFNWLSNSGDNWENAQFITMTDLNGNVVEVENTLGIKSANLFGYCADLGVAQAQNAAYNEIAFKSFEDEGLQCPGANGHISVTNAAQSNVTAHTGSNSLLLNSSGAGISEITFDLDLAGNKAYIIRYWKKDGASDLTLSGGSNPNSTPVYTTVSEGIDGWTQVEISFIADGNTVELTAASGPGQYIDDLRLQPANAAMVTYVFDPNTLLLVAALDDNNFAKVYHYDNEQNLEQVKVETQEGIQTVQLNQTHYKQD